MSMTKKRWTASEDKILRLGLKEGKSASEVARNLGRTASSVSVRKMTLGLKGRFNRSTKVVAQTIRVIKAIQNNGSDPAEIFKIETGVPMPTRYSRYGGEKAKLRATLNQLQVGQSFVMTANLVNSARLMANSEFPEFKIKIVHTTPDKKFARVFRVA